MAEILEKRKMRKEKRGMGVEEWAQQKSLGFFKCI